MSQGFTEVSVLVPAAQCSPEAPGEYLLSKAAQDSGKGDDPESENQAKIVALQWEFLQAIPFSKPQVSHLKNVYLTWLLWRTDEGAYVKALLLSTKKRYFKDYYFQILKSKLTDTSTVPHLRLKRLAHLRAS